MKNMFGETVRLIALPRLRKKKVALPKVPKSPFKTSKASYIANKAGKSPEQIKRIKEYYLKKGID